MTLKMESSVDSIPVSAPQNCDGLKSREDMVDAHPFFELSSCHALVRQENLDSFNELMTAFIDAERRIKRVEWIETKLQIPSINELRYVGYHLFKAFSYIENADKQAEEISRAKRHCKRASYDALELGIIHVLEDIRDFKEEFHDFPVSDVVPDYLDKLKQISSIQKFLENSAGSEDRDSYYEECEKNLSTLEEIRLSLDSARDEINLKRREANDTETRANKAEKRSRILLMVAILSLCFNGLLTANRLTTANAVTESAINKDKSDQKPTAPTK